MAGTEICPERARILYSHSYKKGLGILSHYPGPVGLVGTLPERPFQLLASLSHRLANSTTNLYKSSGNVCVRTEKRLRDSGKNFRILFYDFPALHPLYGFVRLASG